MCKLQFQVSDAEPMCVPGASDLDIAVYRFGVELSHWVPLTASVLFCLG